MKHEFAPIEVVSTVNFATHEFEPTQVPRGLIALVLKRVLPEMFVAVP
jgi:hypothetical protein